MDLDEINGHFRPPPYLTCAVCLEIFKKPRLMPCSHTLCHKCVISIAAYDSHVGQRGRRNENTARCPVCRFSVDKSAMRHLPCNRAIEEAVQHWKIQMEKERVQWIKSKIMVCTKHGEIARVWCPECNTNICPMCTTEPVFSADGHNETHAWHFIDDFEGFCEKRSSALSDLLTKIPQINELGDVVKELSCNESKLIGVYSQFLKDLEKIQTQIYNTLALKFSAAVADISIKLQSPLMHFRSEKETALKNLVSIGKHFSAALHVSENAADIIEPDNEVMTNEQLENFLNKRSTSNIDVIILKKHIAGTLKKAEKLNDHAAACELIVSQSRESQNTESSTTTRSRNDSLDRLSRNTENLLSNLRRSRDRASNLLSSRRRSLSGGAQQEEATSITDPENGYVLQSLLTAPQQSQLLERVDGIQRVQQQSERSRIQQESQETAYSLRAQHINVSMHQGRSILGRHSERRHSSREHHHPHHVRIALPSLMPHGFVAPEAPVPRRTIIRLPQVTSTIPGELPVTVPNLGPPVMPSPLPNMVPVHQGNQPFLPNTSAMIVIPPPPITFPPPPLLQQVRHFM